MRRLTLAAATCAWLVCISLPIVMGMIFDQRGYPDNEELVGNLLSLILVIATLCWGFVLGRLGMWALMGASAVMGAVVTTFLSELSLRLVYRGDPSGPIVGLMFAVVVLGLMLLLGRPHGRLDPAPARQARSLTRSYADQDERPGLASLRRLGAPESQRFSILTAGLSTPAGGST